MDYFSTPFFLVELVFGIVGIALVVVVLRAAKEFRDGFKIGFAKADALIREISQARAAFAPTHRVACKSCGGIGYKVQDNPLIASIAKAIDGE